MKDAHIAKLFDVWEVQNKILLPANKKPLIKIIDQVAALFSAGNTYYFVLNFETYRMDYVSEGTKTILGIESDEFTLEKFLDCLNPEDLEKLHEKESASLNFKLNKIPEEDILKYKTVYLLRVNLKDGTQKTLLHQSKVLNLSNDGKVFQVMSIHTDITYLHSPIDHKISFISSDNKLPSYYSLNTGDSFNLKETKDKFALTPREKQILKKISEGKSVIEIADKLYVSVHTINTHRRNILRKTDCKNMTQLITNCIRCGII